MHVDVRVHPGGLQLTTATSRVSVGFALTGSPLERQLYRHRAPSR